jgi:hypothetical protein
MKMLSFSIKEHLHDDTTHFLYATNSQKHHLVILT